MNVEYGLLYNEQLREVVEPMSEDQARKQWETRGDPFEVLLGDPKQPQVSVQANSAEQVFLVYFYDEHGRRALSYTFAPREGRDELFLENITTWEWDDPSKSEMDEASVIDSYDYREDGYLRHTTDRADSDNYQVEEFSDVPLDINWEPVPRFGDWASLARYRRSLGVDAPDNVIH
jgi:hypothetical protein